jgi:F-type H+-transporting ATPase subunit gamma
MKMIASTKLAKAQRAMQAGKEYGLANSGALSIHPNIFHGRTRFLTTNL